MKGYNRAYAELASFGRYPFRLGCIAYKVIVPDQSTMQIYIKTVTGKLTKLLAEPDDTIENIKWKYTVKVGKELFFLFFNL